MGEWDKPSRTSERKPRTKGECMKFRDHSGPPGRTRYTPQSIRNSGRGAQEVRHGRPVQTRSIDIDAEPVIQVPGQCCVPAIKVEIQVSLLEQEIRQTYNLRVLCSACVHA